MKIEVTLLLLLLELFIRWVPQGIRTYGFPERQLGDLNSELIGRPFVIAEYR